MTEMKWGVEDVTIRSGTVTFRSRISYMDDEIAVILLEVWQYGIRKGWEYANISQAKRAIEAMRRMEREMGKPQ